MTTRTWSGASGSYADPSQWSGNAVPVSGDVAIINSGTVNASGIAFTNITLNINANATAGGTFAFIGDTIGSTSVINVTDSNSFGASPAPTLTFQGTTTNNGTLNFLGTTPIVQFSNGASLINTGVIKLSGSSPQVQTGAGMAAGSISNNGLIQITNPISGYQSAIINATITGTGTITIGAASAISLRSSVASGQTVTFTGGVNAGSNLEIDTPASFGATVTGFVSGDKLILASVPYSNFTYTPTGSSSGTLTVYNGSTVSGQVNLSGVYSQSTFTVQANTLGTGGLNNLIISTAVTNSATGETAAGPVGAVYRFFDTSYGTHFFTSDLGERNTVLATRSDLVEETNGFGDVGQSDPNAVAVYRFFDKTYGTHFFTSNAGERDTIIATRQDLGYEPSSTFYEHSTMQSGDVAVYRLFDKGTGTQFLTGDQGEYKGITTPGSATYRADLSTEGVAFYAPSGSFK